MIAFMVVILPQRKENGQSIEFLICLLDVFEVELRVMALCELRCDVTGLAGVAGIYPLAVEVCTACVAALDHDVVFRHCEPLLSFCSEGGGPQHS